MAHQHYRSPFGDTTYTKLFVGGLAWETPTEVMRSYFEQFGEILEAVIITDKNTGKSKGYGFVTFRDPESARRACADPNPVIDSRRANCNIASLGRPRPSPPRGRNQGGNPYHGGGIGLGASPSSSSPPSYGGGVPPAQLAPPAPPPVVPPVIYPPYGYAAYAPDYGYPQAFYNPELQQSQYYQQPYGSSSAMGSPYFYGYSAQAARGTFPAPQAQRMQGPSYLYYPTQMEGSLPTFPSPPPLRLPLLSQQTRLSLPSTTDSQTPQHTSTETEAAGATASESPKN